MAVIELVDIQQWLELTKIEPSSIDAALEISCQEEAFSRLATKYDVSTWIDASTTPELVKTIVSLLYAGRLWNRSFQAGSSKEGSYGDKLIRRADLLLLGIVEGEYDLIDTDTGNTIDPASDEGPSFFPDDSATELAKTDPEHADAAPQYATMGMRF